jgi:hypothetical protein
MPDLPDNRMAVLNALTEGPEAWKSPQELAGMLGISAVEAEDLLCELDLAGLLEIWETDDGPLVMLSPLAAERLGVRLVEVGAAGTPRWALSGDPDPPLPRARKVCRDERAATLEFVVDTEPPPEVAAARGERAERAERAALAPQAGEVEKPATRTADDFPRPSLLIGLGLTPWPGPGVAQPAGCPACGGQTLGPQMYCLFCDRWGLDRLAFATSQPAAAPGTPAPPTAKPKPPRKVRWDQGEADRQKQRRKAKRKRRKQARLEAEAFLKAQAKSR